MVINATMKAAPDLSVNAHFSLYLVQFLRILALWFHSVWMLWLVEVGEDDGQMSQMYLNHVNLYERTCWDLKGVMKLKIPLRPFNQPAKQINKEFCAVCYAISSHKSR